MAAASSASPLRPAMTAKCLKWARLARPPARQRRPARRGFLPARLALAPSRVGAGCGGRRMFPQQAIPAYKAGCTEPVQTPMPFAAIVQRMRSISLSIGQLTFGSFLLVLAAITATSMASVIAIRHIDATFAELQRLQDVGDLAEEIDRRMNELRLAARDVVTDPNARTDRV